MKHNSKTAKKQPKNAKLLYIIAISSLVLLISLSILGFNNYSVVNTCDQRLLNINASVNSFEQHFIPIFLIISGAGLIALILTKAKNYKLMYILTILFIFVSIAYTVLADLANNTYDQNILNCLSTSIPK